MFAHRTRKPDWRNIGQGGTGARKVYCAHLTEGSTTDRLAAVARMFGCQTDMAMDLLILCTSV